MFGLATLDVLIGLCVMFVLLSLTCSAATELLAGWFRWRQANFNLAISKLLQGDDKSVDAFFAHRRIAALSPEPAKPSPINTARAALALPLLQRDQLKDGDARPVYLAASTFSEVLIDLIVPTDAPPAQRGTFWIVREVVLGDPSLVGSAAATRLNLTKNRALADVLRSFVNAATRAADDGAPDADARRLDALHAAIRQWYDETMLRAAGWYKKKVSGWILIVGLVASICFNLDTLAFTQALYSNPALRQQAAAIGEQLLQAQTNAPQNAAQGDLQNAQAAGALPVQDKPAAAPADQPGLPATSNSPQRGAGVSAPPPPGGASPAAARSELQQYAAQIQQLGTAGLPIGWSGNVPKLAFFPITLKLFGIAMTAVAVSLGAPFWFDLLNKLVNIRNVGKKPPGDGSSPSGGDNSGASGTSRTGLGGPGSPPTSALPSPVSAPIVPPGGGSSRALAAVSQPGIAPDYWSDGARKLDFAKFAPTASGFDPANAAAMARAALLAYQPASVINRMATTCWGATACHFIEAEDTQAFVMEADAFVLVSFRGTEPTRLQDILTDAKYALLPATLRLPGPRVLPLTSGCAHAGFLAALTAVIGDLDAHVQTALKAPGPSGQRKALWVTGHSLGGALATLYAARIACDAQTVIPPGGAPGPWPSDTKVQGLYTFGCPRVGDPTFTAALASSVGASAYRFINHEDIVTRVAPRIMGYDHLGNIMYLDQSGVLDRSGAGWVRFLNTVVDVLGDYKIAAQTAVKDHSMELYLRKIENLVPA